MLKKLVWIKNGGFFEDYRWGKDLPEFSRINVILGMNGTGKTSLAGVFDGVSHPEDTSAYSRLSAFVDEGAGHGGTALETAGRNHPIFGRIFVFSEQYLERNHNFRAGNADMPAVMTIGEKSIEAEQELQRLSKRWQSMGDKRDKALSEARLAENNLKGAYSRVSEAVVAAASQAGGRWASRSKYSVKVVEDAFTGDHGSWTTLNEQDLEAKIAVVRSRLADPIAPLQFPIAATTGFAGNLHSAFLETPVSIILDTLIDNVSASSWVDTGRQFHKHSDTCIFCASPLTQQRRAQIDQHFSNAVQDLQVKLKGQIAETERILDSIQDAERLIPAKASFFENLQQDYQEARDEYTSELNGLKSWAEEVLARARAKLDNVLGQVASEVQEPRKVSAERLVRLINSHNELANSHTASVIKAAQAIESHYLKSEESAIRTYSEIAQQVDVRRGRLDKILEGTSNRITDLESVEGDPRPSAATLTLEVARMLGRNELKFEPEGKRYRVMRGEMPATGLSAGERTAITLIHFFEQVAKFDKSKGEPIVVLDDPVSGLDSEVFMGVSTYIWTKSITENLVGQLFLLTHNFELFRQWDIQIESLHRNKECKKSYVASFYEIRTRYRPQNGVSKRVPELTKWPASDKSRKKIRSTYLHAFMALGEARMSLLEDNSAEKQLDAQLLFPNVIRRLLESFLAFKHPEKVGDFSASMREAGELLENAGYKGDANALRARLTRFAHAYSHNESPATDIIVSPDEVASAIASVFKFMQCLDPAHFDGLCKVAGFKAEDLVGD